MSTCINLLPTLARLANLQNTACDRLALQEAVESLGDHLSPKDQLKNISRHMHLNQTKWMKNPDPAKTPALIYSPKGEWGVLRGLNSQNQWITEWWEPSENQWTEISRNDFGDCLIASLNMIRPFNTSKSKVYQLIKDEIFSHKKILSEALVGTIAINTLALGSSMYTLLVYDKVAQTGAKDTLLVLSIFVLSFIFFEFIFKKIRSRLYERLINEVDQRLARSVFMRFLNVRLDQLPQSVGGLASQIKGYETVRSFMVTATSQLLIDAPFSILFATVLFIIAGKLVLIPVSFFFLSVAIGIYYHKKIDLLAQNANAAANFKTGLLVEAVEGSETIKSGQGGWRMLSRWMNTTDEARLHETKMRNVTEHSQYLVATFQQISYATLVGAGALIISSGQGLTMGMLIACSILSGRILAPVAGIPNLLIQWAHSKAALTSLDKLWELEDDHHGQQQPIILDNIKGSFRFENVSAQYGENVAINIPNLHINAGEKIGILGPVGSGKTTLLRLISGMYKPKEGRITLDDVDLSHVSKPILSEQIGFLQQEGRLFAGTLRENLTLGLLDPGDETILKASKITGLLESVIGPHPKGLQQEIFEGGTGLSGGQRQLANLTRTFLRSPSIWLLDEPTASMDRNLELKVMHSLKEALQQDHTLVLVTHKPEMLNLVDRIIVVANNRIIIDGPKAEVLSKLKEPAQVTKTPSETNQT